MGDEIGLRERKKRQTRKLISDVASGLFIRRGFDNVTVAEVAEAAGVSTKTVFNYFPRKEDLFLDRFPEAVELITQAVRERPEGERPLSALRRLVLGLLERRHPLGGMGDGYEYFWQVVLDSPGLQARAREWADELESLLAALLAEAAGAEPGDPWPRVEAALVVAAYRTAYATGVRRIMAGERADDVIEDHIALLNRSFDALERALDLDPR
ncbi:TetR/AcrR family transcriptional regulator [Planotetraspora sp. A-T 1434]|uniref:TetR/AcrR family transcriptional regulator n=1 Tax=Planotetraspora sp. A-T 1434 TaxID=2979219 RepID=UPI0021C0B683|nr:TetR/AcrR family transcriptional regulator [Planotetraspora sp. A-T 1434]MCT9935157.1 TetR/AcrR family transcriptional regulator [Planotetraspora sp. A-T 1434]